MKVNAYQMTILVLDFEGLKESDIIYDLENQKYFNVNVKNIKRAVVEDWTDTHPLNMNSTSESAYKELFKD